MPQDDPSIVRDAPPEAEPTDRDSRRRIGDALPDGSEGETKGAEPPACA